ncbi:MAG: phosphoadenosine phosphosulfate reductase domain-containing protein [Shimia sp.]
MTRPVLCIPRVIAAEIEAGALFAISHSGGKDSQAMTILLRAVVPAEQIVVIHAPLGRVEWPGTLRHIERTTAGLPLILARARMDFLAMVRRRGRFPTPSIRQCTSDLKRGPIECEVRRYLKANPRFGGRVVSCMGMRADESARRAKQEAVKVNARGSVAGRRWLDWLPIHHLTETQVFETIASAGHRPHWVYRAGMSRCSCSFCIMGSRQDLRAAALLRPALAAEIAALEEEIGHTLSPSRVPLREIVARSTSID